MPDELRASGRRRSDDPRFPDARAARAAACAGPGAAVVLGLGLGMRPGVNEGTGQALADCGDLLQARAVGRPLARPSTPAGSGRRPAVPISISRTMSAWPAWWAVSAIMCTRMRPSVTSALSSFHQGTRPGGFQLQGCDGRVGLPRRGVVERDDLLPGLVGGGPHVVVDRGVLIEPGERLTVIAAERLPEVTEAHTRGVLDQAQQVGSGRGQRPADLPFVEIIEGREQRGALLGQVALEDVLQVVGDVGHPTDASAAGGEQAQGYAESAMSIDLGLPPCPRPSSPRAARRARSRSARSTSAATPPSACSP